MCGLPARSVEFVCAAVALAAPTFAQSITVRASLSSTGTEANGGCVSAAVSADGQFVVFESVGINLVAGDTNGVGDIFVRGRQSGVITRASVSSSGVQANAESLDPTISGDGRYVAFDGTADNLVAGDTNGVSDVFVHDRVTGATVRVSVSTSGVQGDAGSFVPSLSDTGRYVAFESNASTLVTLDVNAMPDVFVHDRDPDTNGVFDEGNGITTRVSESTAGLYGDYNSNGAALSGNGRFVAFWSHATDLVVGDNNYANDVFVRDLQLGTTTLVSVNSNGVQGDSSSSGASLSFDGRYIAFSSVASNLVAGDTNGRSDIFVRDLLTGTTARASASSNGIQGNDHSYVPSLSSDGQHVAFISRASTLVAGDSNGLTDAFVRDLVSGVTERVSVDSNGVRGNSYTGNVVCSADARFVAFSSSSTNLVLGDTNSCSDIFIREPQVFAYCSAGITTNGCVASISGSGTASASATAGFTINVQGVEGLKAGIVFYGVDNFGFTPAPWGAGTSYLCIKHPTQRMGMQNSGGTFNQCNGALAIDWNAYVAVHPNALGVPFAAGQHVYAQAWFRDPPAPKSTNLSNALEFEVGP